MKDIAPIFFKKRGENPQDIRFTGEARGGSILRMKYVLRGRISATCLGYSLDGVVIFSHIMRDH